ncbi:MAG: S-layer homology domain-containing protein [Candidatus Sericytochromatia bacterium]|nr:S-layer homology domain-containing protein [Candidatus Sericytochromatia bacterium]
MRFKYPAAALAVAAALMVASPAQAQRASTTFKDLPENHWAERAVTLVAVEKAFMKGYPDQTFRGELPFTRIQLALAVDELIRLLEKQTKVSWRTEGLGGYAFQDLPEGAEVREAVLRLANHYRLFEGVPGVTSNTLESYKQVTRYEMAKVVHRLMRLGEARGVVDPSVQKPQIFTFSDVPRTAWAYNEVKDVADRYQVMVGFPDATFRGSEELTRYQFAASAAQTFPLVVALVEKTQERQQEREAEKVASSLRFQEDLPLALGAGAGFAGAPAAGGLARGALYMGPVFVMADAQTAVSANGARQYGLEGDLGYALPLATGWHLQPYVGARTLTDGQAVLSGISYGALTYWRPVHSYGAHLRLQGMSPLQGNAQGAFLGSGALGLWWHPSTSWGLFLEGGMAQWPGAVPAANTPFTSEWLPSLTLGTGLRF